MPLDTLFGDLGTTVNDFLASPAFQIGIRAIGIYFVLLWLACAFWAYRDMRLRTANPVAPYLAAALIVAFTPVFFFLGVLLYRIMRPKETMAEANDRALAEEAMLAEVSVKPHCANCTRPVHEEWIICPTCRNRLRRVCPNCERLVELDWSICAWCGKDFERAEPIGAVYMPPTRGAARPTAPPRQPAPRQPMPPTPTPRPQMQLPAMPGAPGPAPTGAPVASGPPAPASRGSAAMGSAPVPPPSSQALAGEH